MEGGRRRHVRWASVLLVVVLLSTSFLLLAARTVSAQGVSFVTTADFDSGLKASGGDGNLLVETQTDNPGIAPNHLELGSLKGDAFNTPDANADSFKWDIPSTCLVRTPTTVIRDIAGGVLQLGSNKSSSTTYAGVVTSAAVNGNLDVRVLVNKIRTDSGAHFVLELVNEHRCYWENSKTVDGIQYVWDEGTAGDGKYVLEATTILNGATTAFGGTTQLTANPVWMRITRAANVWSLSYSVDGLAWTLDKQTPYNVTGPLYASLLEKDNRAGLTTEFDEDNFTLTGSLTAGGYRTSGAWTSPSFNAPAGEVLDHITITGSFNATDALDRVELLQGGTVIQTFEADNSLILYPSGDVSGSGLALRLTLKGDGLGTPSVTGVAAAFRSSFPITGETVNQGTSTGILNETKSDGLFDGKTEALGPVTSTGYPGGQTLVAGSQVGGAAPPNTTSTGSFDGNSAQYTEANVPTFSDTAPSTQTVAGGTAGGTFPACAASADGNNCTLTEAGTTSESSFYPGSQDVAPGSQVAGTFPTDLQSSDGSYLQYQEGATGTTTTDYVPASQAVLQGAEGVSTTYAQGDFARKTDGPGVQHVTTVGFQGKALILWWTRQSAYGTTAPNIAGIGLVASPTQEYAIGWADDNNVAPSNSGRWSAAAAVLLLMGGTPTLDGMASFLGFTATGFDLNWTTNPNPAQATILHYIVLGSVVTNAYVGQFVGPAAGATGARSYTGVGFHGDAAIFLGDLQTSLGAATGGTFGFGAATGPSNMGTVANAIPDATTTAYNKVTMDNRSALTVYNPGLSVPATDQIARFVSFDADGFTLNHVQATTGNVLFWALVLKGGQYQANAFIRNTNGGVQSVTGVGFHPNGVLFFSGMLYKSFGFSDTGAEMSFGAASVTSSGVVQTVTWDGSNDARSPTQAHMSVVNNEVMRDLSLSSQAAQNLGAYTSSDPDGFTVTWSTVQAASGQKWLFLAFGGSGSGNPFPGCIQSSDNAFCTYQETYQSATNDYRVAVKYGFTGVNTTGSGWHLFVEGREGATNPEPINVSVYASNGVDLRVLSCVLGSTANTVYDCGELTGDELSGGSPSILFTDSIRSPDPNASSFDLDTAYIERTAMTESLGVAYTWSAIPAGGGSYELRLEGHVSDEAMNLQVLTPPSMWTTRLTLSSLTDVNLSYVLSSAEFNGGAPQIRFVDSNPGDGIVSSLWLDVVQVVRVDTTYSLAAQYDWSSNVDVHDGATLLMTAAASGDAEGILVEVYDWQDATWRTAFTINSATPAVYGTTLAAACTAAPGDCEVSSPTGGSVRVRFSDLNPADTTLTTLAVDQAVVRSEASGFALDVRYNWTLGGRSGEDALWIGGNRSDEDLFVQVYDWAAGVWNTRLVINSTSDVLQSYILTDAEVSPSYAVLVRFVGSQDTVDSIASSLWIDYAAIASRDYGLSVIETIGGISGTGPFTLVLQGGLASAGENFNVYVFNASSASWSLWINGSFTTSQQIFSRVLASSEVDAGTVQVMIVDAGSAYDPTPSTLLLDFVGVS